MNRLTLSTVFTASLFLAALPGCNLFSSKSPGPLIVDSRSPISDVPVPAGFTMTGDSTSRVDASAGLRVVDHRYSGSDELLSIVAFYKENLPAKNWTLADQSQLTGKEVILHFTKKNEDCHVFISKHLVNTHIRVKIDPASKTATAN